MKIKGFDKNLKCRGFQFEIGKTYDTGAAETELELCSDKVFHYCNNLRNVHRYYSVKPEENNRFCEIEVLGAEVTDGEKCGSNRIRIVREIAGEELNELRGLMNGNTGVFNTGNRNTGDCNTGNRNTGYFNTGNYNTGDRNTGYFNTGNFNIGNRNTGMFNICDYSSGFFCTVEPKARVFDVELDMTVSEFRNTKYFYLLCKHPFVLTEWICYTEEEKQTDKEKELIGGYLKEYSFKEACAAWWAHFDEEEKETFMEMPGFDANKFKQITGIDAAGERK